MPHWHCPLWLMTWTHYCCISVQHCWHLVSTMNGPWHACMAARPPKLTCNTSADLTCIICTNSLLSSRAASWDVSHCNKLIPNLATTGQYILTWKDKMLYGNLICFRTENVGIVEVLDTWGHKARWIFAMTRLCTHVCLHIGHMISSNTSQYLQYRNVSKI